MGRRFWERGSIGSVFIGKEGLEEERQEGGKRGGSWGGDGEGG